MFFLFIDLDESVVRICLEIRDWFGVDVGIIVNDSFGCVWWYGMVGYMIGLVGVCVLDDLWGESDWFGGEF